MNYIIPNKFVEKCWVFFEPIGGVSDTRDKKTLERHLGREVNVFLYRDCPFWAYFPEKNKSRIKRVKGLKKAYNVIFITDVQFGHIKIDHLNKELSIPYTQKQLEKSFTVGGSVYVELCNMVNEQQ